jgi:hypothetical protein
MFENDIRRPNTLQNYRKLTLILLFILSVLNLLQNFDLQLFPSVYIILRPVQKKTANYIAKKPIISNPDSFSSRSGVLAKTNSGLVYEAVGSVIRNSSVAAYSAASAHLKQ